MDRKAKVLNKITKNGLGLEIGASFGGFAPKREGFNTKIIDHLSKNELIEKYKPHNLPVENIEEVDFVWNGESYADLTGNKNYYDWIIASHLIEHTPDLIGFINSCQEVLKEDGVISLVVPDARYCFDYFRPITGISKIIDAHLQKNKVHTVGTITEFSLNTVKQNDELMWDEFSENSDFKFINSIEESKKMIKSAGNGEYVDSHCWCFTPHSFRLLIHDLNLLGFIQAKEIEFFPTDGGEFYLTLSKSGKYADFNRMDYLKKIKDENMVNINLPNVLRTTFSKKTNYQINRLLNSLKYRLSLFSKK